MEEVIQFKDVWETYRIKFIIDGRTAWEDFSALKGISFKVARGEALAIIGENGAGKSTVLKLIAGMLKPDQGEVAVSGRVSGLLELGAGFQPELTGRENIYLNAALFGLTQGQIEEKYGEIAEFASLGKFINAPVKCYSQGMFVRLAFAVAIHVNPDILLIDDLFAVGDIYAQRKCINKIFELKEKGVTILIALQDLKMLRRVCSRGIFLREGAIIKDGPIETVSSYYTETVGHKKGIAIAQRGPLGVVFNNGKLILKWNDETITSDLGGYTNMLISGREYLSTTADWEVQKSDTPEEISAVGKWPDIPVSQHWKIAFSGEKGFLWSTTIQGGEDIRIDKTDATVSFIDQYKKWFTPDGETDFPGTFIHEMEGECFSVDDSANRLIGFRASDNAARPVPTVIFDRLRENIKAVCEVGNTGAEYSGRLIHFRAPSSSPGAEYVKGKYNSYFQSRVVFFGPEETGRLEDYLRDARQIMRESTIINKGPLGICCKDKRVEISWQDKLLTSGMGLNTKFKYREKDYSSADWRWEVRKESEEEILVTIAWHDGPPFTQRWRIKLKDNNTILWEAEMITEEKIKLRNKQAELMLSEEYREWLTIDRTGDFQKLEKRGNAVLLNKYINDVIGVESIREAGEVIFPGLLFRQGGESPKATYIFKVNQNHPITGMRFLEIDRKENIYTLPGKSVFFSGEIRIVSDKEAASELTEVSGNKPGAINLHAESFGKIELERLALVFDYGKGRIFWEGAELTKGLGLYTSVFFKDMWYDSSQAFWQVQKSNGNKLVAVGHWPWIALTQTWDICLLDEKTISFRVEKEIWEDVTLEREQADLMLSDKYEEWFVDRGVHGKFPRRFSEHDGVFWDRLWCGDTSLPVRIKKGILSREPLPSIAFDCSKNCQARYFAIENTDDLFHARVLECELNSGAKADGTTGQNGYFAGQIKIVI